MRPFAYTRASAIGEVVATLQGAAGAKIVAGGTNLVDLMKADVMQPPRLVDITRLPLRTIEARADGGLRIGALVTNATTAYDGRIAKRYPLLSQAILAGASAQLRNVATTGGNLLQRTRCYYFYDTTTPCNKREPGTGCSAKEGVNRIHAILGTSEHCIAVHPSDMCVAMAALGATVQVTGPRGERAIAFADFHRLPGDTPHLDATLAPEELITAVDLPADTAALAAHSAYLKIRDRNSYAFALVSVAAGLAIEGGVVRDARIALGGVAHKPWRVPAAEQLLVGHAPGTDHFHAAADVLIEGAVGREHNSFKTGLAKRSIVRALQDAVEAGA